MCLVVVRVELGLDPIHVGGQNRPGLPNVVTGHLRLFQLATGQDVGNGNLCNYIKNIKTSKSCLKLGGKLNKFGTHTFP